jgi:hypothetical protein
MNTVHDLVKCYNPDRVTVWFGEETLYDGGPEGLLKIVGECTEWACYEYFKDKGELIINV